MQSLSTARCSPAATRTLARTRVFVTHGFTRPPLLSRAKQQRRADLAFERADLLAERRLLHVQFLGRAGHMTFASDGDEIAEVSQFHVHIH